MASGDVLDTSRAQEKLWIVKLPKAVSDLWLQRCEQSMRAHVGEEDIDALERLDEGTSAGEVLGEIHIQKVPGQKDKLVLRVPKELVGSGVPSEYSLASIPVNGHVAAFCQDLQPSTSAPAQQQRVGSKRARGVEGVAVHRLDAQPSIEDRSYWALSQQRSAASALRPSSVQEIDGRDMALQEKEQAKRGTTRLGRGGINAEPAFKPAPGKELGKDDLESALLQRFRRASNWKLQQLVAELQQSGAAIKRALADIAILHLRGPLQGTYTLKDEYKRRSESPAPPSGPAPMQTE